MGGATNGLIKLSSQDAISMLIFGVLYFLFAYGIVFGYYAFAIKNIKEGRASASSIVLKAFLLQIASLVFVWVLILLLNIFTKYSNMDINFSDATILFFDIDWLRVNLSNLVDELISVDKPIAIVAIYLLIKAIWIVVTVLFVLFPLILIMTVIVNEITKFKNQNSDQSQISLVANISASLIVLVIVYAVHFAFPTTFLDGLASSRSSDSGRYSAYLTDVPNFGEDFSYKRRVKHFVADSIGL